MKFDTEKIRKLPFFAGIGTGELEEMLSWLRAETAAYQKGEILFRQGDRMDRMGIVLEGQLSLEREDFWGNRNILASVGRGEVFGEVYACRKDQALAVRVAAVEPTRVLFLKIGPVLQEGRSAGRLYDRLSRNLIHILAEKTYMMSRKNEYLAARGIREKLMAYLSGQADLEGKSEFSIPFNRQELADFLSVDRSALSRELGKMKTEGILECRKNHFRLFQHGQAI